MPLHNAYLLSLCHSQEECVFLTCPLNDCASFLHLYTFLYGNLCILFSVVLSNCDDGDIAFDACTHYRECQNGVWVEFHCNWPTEAFDPVSEICTRCVLVAYTRSKLFDLCSVDY